MKNILKILLDPVVLISGILAIILAFFFGTGAIMAIYFGFTGRML